jgi:hypothetical protein
MGFQGGRFEGFGQTVEAGLGRLLAHGGGMKVNNGCARGARSEDK